MAATGFYFDDNTFFRMTIVDSENRKVLSLGQLLTVNNFKIPTSTAIYNGLHTIYPLAHDSCIGPQGFIDSCVAFYTTLETDGTPSYSMGVYRATSVLGLGTSNMHDLTQSKLEAITGNITWSQIGFTGTQNPDGFIICIDLELQTIFCGYVKAGETVINWDVSNNVYTSSGCNTDGMFPLSTKDTQWGLISDYTPNVNGGISTSGGGDGAFEISSDIIEEFDVSKLISAINTGFMRAYAIKPTEMQLIRDLATYMWTSNFVDNLKKLWGDPMNVIMGLSAIPVTPARGGVQNVVLGNVQSPVAMPPATSQYVVHNCGSITIKKYWGNYLDYKYTKASIYLPFIGGQELDIQKVMGKTLSLAYIIDIVSGACSAQLVADGSVIGNWQGSCAMGLPISAENFSRYYVGALGSAGAGLIKGASAGPIGALAGAITGAAVNAAMNAPHVEMNGNVSGAGGYMSCRRPYIQLTLPRQSLAEIYNEIEGYPCNVTYTLGDLTGYTIVSNVHLEGIIATADELEEIEDLLKSGVIF